MKSKTIILSSQDENRPKSRGILTLSIEDDLLMCKMRLYETPSLNRDCKIGIYHNKKVFSANLLEKQGVYTSSIVGDFNIDNDFYAAIIDTKNSNNILLSGGTYAGYFFNDNSVFEKDFPKNNATENAMRSFDCAQGDIRCYSEWGNAEPKNPLSEEEVVSCKDCENCVYKQYFY